MLAFDENDELFVGDDILNEFGECTSCGLCCLFFSDLIVYEKEISTIAETLQITTEEFKQKYIKSKEKKVDNSTLSLQVPCPFLMQKKCRIYKHRFLVCRTFPLCINLTKNEAVLSGIYLCPQATQFYEGLLDFYEQQKKEIYDRLIKIEKKCDMDENGLEIQGKASLFTAYLDYLNSR